MFSHQTALALHDLPDVLPAQIHLTLTDAWRRRRLRVPTDVIIHYSEHPSPRIRAYWSAVARWLGKDRRFARLLALHEGPALDLLPVGTDFQIGRLGEDPRFAGSALRVPAETLRDRAADVLTPEALVRLHPGYRNRVRMGPTWRADVWTALERAPDLSAAEAARKVGCSFAAAWQVVQDFGLLRSARRYATQPDLGAQRQPSAETGCST